MNNLLNRSLYYLGHPIALIGKIRERIVLNGDKRKFSIDMATTRQEDFFAQLDINRNKAIELLSHLLGADYKIDSEHHLFFAGLAARYKSKKFNRILEIGTYDGSNAALLSKLFPSAEVTTIDLPDDDPIFLSSYNRSDRNFLESFINLRKNNLDSTGKIKFIQNNSLNLIDVADKFDLVWVDGAHGYPVVAVDITNALRLVGIGGFVVCDDVWIGRDETERDHMYKSDATHEVLRAFEQAGIVEYKFIYKRISFESIGIRTRKEFIAVAVRV
jgi:predicted O-methyltransferase YrrM